MQCSMQRKAHFVEGSVISLLSAHSALPARATIAKMRELVERVRKMMKGRQSQRAADTHAHRGFADK